MSQEPNEDSAVECMLNSAAQWTPRGEPPTSLAAPALTRWQRSVAQRRRIAYAAAVATPALVAAFLYVGHPTTRPGIPVAAKPPRPTESRVAERLADSGTARTGVFARAAESSHTAHTDRVRRTVRHRRVQRPVQRVARATWRTMSVTRFASGVLKPVWLASLDPDDGAVRLQPAIAQIPLAAGEFSTPPGTSTSSSTIQEK